MQRHYSPPKIANRDWAENTVNLTGHAFLRNKRPAVLSHASHNLESTRALFPPQEASAALPELGFDGAAPKLAGSQKAWKTQRPCSSGRVDEGNAAVVSGTCCSRVVSRGICSSRVETGSSSEDDRLLFLRRFLDLTLGSFFAFFFFFTFLLFFLVLSGVSGGGGKGSNAELHDDMSSSQAMPSAMSVDILAESQTAAAEIGYRSIDDFGKAAPNMSARLDARKTLLPSHHKGPIIRS